jgi:hypothetical protein
MKELMAVVRPLGAGTRRLAGVTVKGCPSARNTTTTKENDMGDIGEEKKHIELEPVEVPLSVPVPEEVPA